MEKSLNQNKIEIEKDFYNLVERPGYLKHILYGDSVSGDHKINCLINNKKFLLKIKDFWNILENQNKIENIDNNEYIFNFNKIKILNYNIKNDNFEYICPKYIMRHKFNGNCVKVFYSNNSFILATKNHSFVDVYKNEFIKKKYNEITFLPCISNFNQIDNIDDFAYNLGNQIYEQQIILSKNIYNNLQNDYSFFISFLFGLFNYKTIKSNDLKLYFSSFALAKQIEYLCLIHNIFAFTKINNSLNIELNIYGFNQNKINYNHHNTYDNLNNIKPIKILKINEINYNDYVYDFEFPKNHIFIIDGIIVHNTDSIFINIPDKSTNINDKINKMNKVLTDVNDLIVDYTKNTLMPRCGFESDRCETNFKGEMLIDSILFIDVKKSYAYRQIASEAELDSDGNLINGKIFTNPLIVKRSTLGLKGDTIALTKDIMNDIINISFDDSIHNNDKKEAILKKIKTHYNLFLDAISTLNCKLIGAPVRWQKKDYVIYGMKLFNALVEPSFQYLSSGYAVYCNFTSLNKIKELNLNIPVDKIKMIVFPNEFDVEKAKNQMSEYGIIIDKDEQWSKIYNTVCQRLMNNIK